LADAPSQDLTKQALHTLAQLHSELAGKLSANQRETKRPFPVQFSGVAKHLLAVTREVFGVKNPEVRRRKQAPRLFFYNVADLLTVMQKAQLRRPLAKNVARAIQGSGSINERLLEVVARSE
jgi:hypothetical protein